MGTGAGRAKAPGLPALTVQVAALKAWGRESTLSCGYPNSPIPPVRPPATPLPPLLALSKLQPQLMLS